MAPSTRRSGNAVDIWPKALHLCFLLLCLRFLLAAIAESNQHPWPAIILAVGSFGIGFAESSLALVAFSAAMPLLRGQDWALETPVPVTLVFSAIFVGISARFKPSAKDHSRQDTTDDGTRRFVLLLTDLFISSMLCWLTVQVVRHCTTKASWEALLLQAQPSQAYYLTSGFIWLQGLFYFRLLLERNLPKEGWLTVILASFTLTVAAFFVFQVIFGIPDPYEPTATRFQFAPFEDIHSFGSIVVALFAYAVASWPKWASGPLKTSTLLTIAGRGLWVVALAYLVASSWSRAAWLAACVILAAICLLRLSWKPITAFAVIGAAFVTIFNRYVGPRIPQQDYYLYRLASLLRFEPLGSKDPARINLYHKAFAMIRQRPLFGYGIGSFYQASVAFAKAGDPMGQFPNYAHNFILQLAAELGAPATLLFLALVGFILFRGLATANVQYRQQKIGHLTPAAAGTAMALAAYLVTQMTANSLNIYVSNQFFFFFLLAAVLAGSSEIIATTAKLSAASASGADALRLSTCQTASSPFIQIPPAVLREIATNSDRIPTLYFSRNKLVRVFFWMRLRLIYRLMRTWTRDWSDCLDFCGGGGVLHPTLAGAFLSVTSVDLETFEAEKVRRRYNLQNVELVQGDIQEINLPGAPFSNIVAADVLEHFQDLAIPIAALQRWLRDNGVLFTSLPTESRLYEFLRRIFGATKPVDHYHTAEQVERYLENSGFQRLERRSVPLPGSVLALFSICAWVYRPQPPSVANPIELGTNALPD